MPLEKQSLNNFLPNGFETLNQEGYKENFSEDKIATGYEKDVPDIVSGPNLNNLIDVVGKNTNTLNNYVEYLNGMPINNVPTVNEFNQLDYTNLDDKLTKKQITNCILEIPQRIKLELVDGTLTLKAGSEVIVPNGFEADGTTPKFDYVTIESDISYSNAYTQAVSCFAIYNTSKNTVEIISYADSNLSYNLTTNKVGHTDIPEILLSFPIALVVRDTIGISSITQIFNGMGYIGSTIWVDKGVKGLIPNGRNEDGTLRNIEYANNKISMHTFTGGYADTFYLRLEEDANLPNHSTQIRYNIKSFSNAPTPTVGKWYSVYVEDENMFYYSNNGGAYFKDSAMDLGVYSASADNKITSLKPKQPFRVVDWNDSSTVSGWAMPSSKYIDLTLGASGTTYTAPANGWVTLWKAPTADGQVLEVEVGAGRLGAVSIAKGTSWLRISLPVKKGDKFIIAYSAQGTTQIFRFIYAEGEI